MNAEEYDALDWDSELDIYEDRTIDRMSQDEVRNKISELTDEDTKFRLNAWLEHDPAEIFSNIGVPSLQEYIVFLYPGFGLAVFESFVPGNAYYAFRYTEFEKLLNRVSSLTKTQMLMNSAFLNRGCRVSKGCRKMYSVDKRSADGVKEAMEDGGITFILQICGYSTGKVFFRRWK